MKPAFEDMNLQIPAVTAEPEDYTGEDGLLYCGKCRTPKEAYFPADKATLFGRDRHPAECDCQRAQRMEREAAVQKRRFRLLSASTNGTRMLQSSFGFCSLTVRAWNGWIWS